MKKQKPRRMSAVARERLEIAAAAAHETVTQLHVERAQEFIDLAEGRVPALRMLDIYIRLQALTASQGPLVRNRALAALGKGEARDIPRAVVADGETGEVEEAERPSIWRLVRGRLRGRVNASLRRAVELHTGATQRLLLETHVRQARSFVAVLGDGHPIVTACALYNELLHVPPPLALVIYPLVLDRMAGEEMPRRWAVASPAPPHSTRNPTTVRPIPMTST